MTINTTIGDKIKFIREIRGYKQDVVATELGISQNGYSKIERGDTDVPFSRLEQIAKVLDIPLKDLVSINQEQALYSIINHNPQINTQASVSHANPEDQTLLERIAVLEQKLTALEKQIGIV